MTGNLFGLLRERCTDPAKIVLETDQARVLTYRELFDLSARFASALSRLGVAPGDRVAAQIDKSPEAIALYLGCLRAGAAFLPLSTAYMAAELDYFIADAEPRLCVSPPQRRADMQAAVARHGLDAAVETLAADGSGSLSDLARDGADDFRDVPRQLDDLAAMLYTSGTTGRPKGAMLSHGNLSSNALALADIWRFTSADVLLHALPIFHTHGLFVATNTLLAASGSMLFLERFEPSTVLRLLPSATVMMGVPTFYARLLREERLDRAATADIRLFISGSAPLSAELHRQWSKRTGHAILERYGMTETGMIASNPCVGERLPGAVGFPLPDVALRVADPQTGRAVAEGEIGGVEVKGPNVFSGYWRNPDKTAAAFRPDGFFITGDLGFIDAGGYLHLVGRGTDLVISGGYNVYPKEVEAEIDAIAGIVESAVIGLPHADFGEAVTAVAVVAPDASLGEAEIIAALRRRLAGYKLPKRVILASKLPRNAMGKVEKARLRQEHAGLYQPPVADA